MSYTFTVEKDRFRYSVLEVAGLLHSQCIGTRDMAGPAAFFALVEWLDWRVTDGWVISGVEFDVYVQRLARTAVAEARAKLKEIAATEAKPPRWEDVVAGLPAESKP